MDAMKDDYRLILIDARGHGGSDKPHDVEASTWSELVLPHVTAFLNKVAEGSGG